MEKSHKDSILNMMPGIDKKVRLLGEGDNIPDPIGQEIGEYRRVRDIIKDRIENVFLELFKMEIK
jgi:protein-tyrosine-phosphatase